MKTCRACRIRQTHASRRAEDSLIIAVRKSLEKNKPNYLRHIVELKCSVTRTMDQMGLPRVRMNLRPEQADERVCRTLVLKRYQRLETVVSVEDFKTIFIGVVRGERILLSSSRNTSNRPPSSLLGMDRGIGPSSRHQHE